MSGMTKMQRHETNVDARALESFLEMLLAERCVSGGV